MDGYLYLLECADGSYYTGSTNDLNMRLQQHCDGIAANHTKKRVPVNWSILKNTRDQIMHFLSKKPIQGWRREKKEALIKGEIEKLPELAMAYRDKFPAASSASATGLSIDQEDSKEKISTSPLPEALEGNDKRG